MNRARVFLRPAIIIFCLSLSHLLVLLVFAHNLVLDKDLDTEISINSVQIAFNISMIAFVT